MPRSVAIGEQNFASIIERGCFYVDKTDFIREWWESNDSVTLITRPRRFGKTLNLNMTERFFSSKYAGQDGVFHGLKVWEHEKMRGLQGAYPVISLSFAGVKETTYAGAIRSICNQLRDVYVYHRELQESDALSPEERAFCRAAMTGIPAEDATDSLKRLCGYLERHHGRKVLILLDEYDTPMQEAYVSGYWNEIVGFTRSLFNNTFKTNPSLGRALMTGITRVSRESLFSDLNNIKVMSLTTEKYETAFGFTEDEVFAAMDEFGLTNRSEVQEWYDGFTIGTVSDIYNPWSVINFLDKGKLGAYWANTSSNRLASHLIRGGSVQLKCQFGELLRGGVITVPVTEQVVFSEMSGKASAVWGLLLATGYLRVVSVDNGMYTLSLTNKEVRISFEDMVAGWFDEAGDAYGEFTDALLQGDVRSMNKYMNQVALSTFSFFDTGNNPSNAEPERFYHGFVLGLTASLSGRYDIASNRESGYGRCDVMMVPKGSADPAVIMEFKVLDPEANEKTLQDTLAEALRQIDDRHYDRTLLDRGIAPERIKKYGFAFRGKEVLIGE